METSKDRTEETDASQVEQHYMGVFQPSISVLPDLHALDNSPETACLLRRTSSNPMGSSSPSTSHPDSHSDLPPPPPYPSRISPSSTPTRSSSFPTFPSPSSSPIPSSPPSFVRPTPSENYPHSLLPSSSSSSSSSPLHPTPGGERSPPRLRVEILEQLSHCASISLEEQQHSRVILGETARSLGSLAVSLQDLVESQREFAHDSLKIQREMVDTLRQFSASTLTLLRDKVDGHVSL